RASPNAENQLISLWSAVEVLLSEPPRDVARISHYCRMLIPCASLRHVRRQMVAAYDEMLVSYRRRFSEIVNSEPNDFGNSHTNFAALLCLEENEPLRKRLMTLCKDNPLALHRMWKLRTDYKEPKSALRAISGHEKRVEWQICRIYRARNFLVHTGRIPT